MDQICSIKERVQKSSFSGLCPGLYIVDPAPRLVADGVLLAMQDVVDAHIGHQVDVDRVVKGEAPHNVIDLGKSKFYGTEWFLLNTGFRFISISCLHFFLTSSYLKRWFLQHPMSALKVLLYPFLRRILLFHMSFAITNLGT